MNPKRKLDESDITKRDLNCSRYWRQIKPKYFPHLMGFRLCERSPRFPLWYYSNKILQFYPFFFLFSFIPFIAPLFSARSYHFHFWLHFLAADPAKLAILLSDKYIGILAAPSLAPYILLSIPTITFIKVKSLLLHFFTNA